jgi:hypothetical protein
MRAAKLTLITLFLFATSAAHAFGDSIAAYSLFGGTITQAPAGNVFGVGAGDTIHGEIFWPPGPIYPAPACFTSAGCTDTNFSIALTIGGVTYPPDPIFPNGSVTLLNGLITGVIYAWPPDPCSGTTQECPAFTLAGNQLYTGSSCTSGAVCGTLNFANSQITPTPEPLSIVLVMSGLLSVAFRARSPSNAKDGAQPTCHMSV